MNGNVAEKCCTETREERLSIEVTTHCNSDCLHCFVQSSISKRSSLSVDVVNEVISDGYNIAYRHLHITGGEPLLWNGLFDTLDYAFGIGYQKISINTNGKLITEDVACRLAAYKGLSISVSLDGPKTLHDHLRGRGSYSQAVLGIKKAIEAGIDLVIFTVARKCILNILPYFVDNLYKQFPDIKYITLIQLIVPMSNGFAISGDCLGPEDFLQFVRLVGLLNLYGLRTNVKNNPLVTVVSKLLEMPWISPTYPLSREGCLIVMADGNICVSHSNRYSFGRYVPGSLKEILISKEYLSRVTPNNSICPSCEYTIFCKENGMVGPSEQNCDMHAEQPFCKRVIDRIGL